VKQAMIIGASVGLGRYLAAGLAQQGWRVVGVSRRAGESAEFGFEYVRADLSIWADIDRLKQHLASDPPDLVVFNAVMYASSPAGHETPDELETLFRVNTVAPYTLLHDYLRAAGGTLRTCVVVNSDAIYHASLQSGAYAATKAALRVLTTVLAQASKSRNAAVATLLLGPLADERKLSEFKKIAKKQGIDEGAVTKIFLERSNPAFVVDALIPYEACLESVKYIVSLGRVANGLLCKLDGGSSGSLI
jgi:NAD(P)-dependent dehydrogenase (short-subunit alcohol dehydrogenase family)